MSRSGRKSRMRYVQVKSDFSLILRIPQEVCSFDPMKLPSRSSRGGHETLQLILVPSFDLGMVWRVECTAVEGGWEGRTAVQASEAVQFVSHRQKRRGDFGHSSTLCVMK